MVTVAVFVGLVTSGPSPHRVKPHAHAPDYSKLNLVHYPYVNGDVYMKVLLEC